MTIESVDGANSDEKHIHQVVDLSPSTKLFDLLYGERRKNYKKDPRDNNVFSEMGEGGKQDCTGEHLGGYYD